MPALRLPSSARDKLSTAFVWGCAAVFGAAACFLIYSVVSAGVMHINWEFVSQEPAGFWPSRRHRSNYFVNIADRSGLLGRNRTAWFGDGGLSF